MVAVLFAEIALLTEFIRLRQPVVRLRQRGVEFHGTLRFQNCRVQLSQKPQDVGLSPMKRRVPGIQFEEPIEVVRRGDQITEVMAHKRQSDQE